MSLKKNIIAICYDFDKTLSPDDMQTYSIIPSLGMTKKDFWEESNSFAKENKMDLNLAWMYKLIRYSNLKEKSISFQTFREAGKKVELFPGLDSWFNNLNQYAEERGLILEHYIISSGLKEIIEGTSIAGEFKKIYGSTYYYTADKVASWPAQVINFTNKTEYIFRIAKGVLDVWDQRVNNHVERDLLRIPYNHIIYIGDSMTDIPCMTLVKERNGYSIGVYDPLKEEPKPHLFDLFIHGRINFLAPANYEKTGELYSYITKVIDRIAKEEEINDIHKDLIKNKELLKASEVYFDTLMDQNNVHHGDIATGFKNFLKSMEQYFITSDSSKTNVESDDNHKQFNRDLKGDFAN